MAHAQAHTQAQATPRTDPVASGALDGLIDIIARKVAEEILGLEPGTIARDDARRAAQAELDAREIRPSTPRMDILPLKADLLTFRPRYGDFAWGDRITGEMASQLGYRIHVAFLADSWIVTCPRGRRLGEYTDLRAAAQRAADHLDRRYGALTEREHMALLGIE